jgi:hypothetical protein
VIVFFEHLAQTRRGDFVPSLFELICKESRIVTDFIYIETKSPIDDRKKLTALALVGWYLMAAPPSFSGSGFGMSPL